MILNVLAGPVGYLPILVALLVLMRHEIVRVIRDDDASAGETQTARRARLVVVAVAVAFGLITLRLTTLAA